MEYIVLAIPFFFILIAVEWVLSAVQRRQLYRLNDSINDLSMGIIDQVGGAFLATIVFAGYLLVWDQFRLFDFGATSMWDATGIAAWVWVTCFICKDFMYYWAHRLSHEMNIGWATHIAHHQSEEFNLSVALRQGVFQGFFFNIFYLPLAFLGFPPVVYVTCSAFNTIYQFWIHTRLVGKLGPIEWIMNTPSHHRVHHGRDVKYIDRNHAGVFIIWDRMFGTFQEEEEEPNYGLVTPLASWNPLWAQVHYFVKIGRLAWRARRWQDKVRVFYKEPAWLPEGVDAPTVSSQELWAQGKLKKYDTRTPLGMKFYVLLHFVAVLVLAVGFLKSSGDMEWLPRACAAGMVFWALLSFGGIFESRRWALYAELARVIALAASITAWGPWVYGFEEFSSVAVRAGVLGVGVVSIVWMLAYRKTFSVPLIRTTPEELELEEERQIAVEPERTQEA